MRTAIDPFWIALGVYVAAHVIGGAYILLECWRAQAPRGEEAP